MVHASSRLSLGTREFRPAAQRLTDEEGAVFEVTDVYTSWSLDFASDLFWIQAKPRIQLENHRVSQESHRHHRLGSFRSEPSLESPAVQPCIRTEAGC